MLQKDKKIKNKTLTANTLQIQIRTKHTNPENKCQRKIRYIQSTHWKFSSTKKNNKLIKNQSDENARELKIRGVKMDVK